MRIEVENQPAAELIDELVAGVRAHNFESLGDERSRPLATIARDAAGLLIGGVSGRTIYRQFLIDVVWVAKPVRGTGLGRQLMALAEAEAVRRGCVAAQVDTLAFQGPVFYEKLGFTQVGRVSGIPESPDRFFLLKRYA